MSVDEAFIALYSTERNLWGRATLAVPFLAMLVDYWQESVVRVEFRQPRPIRWFRKVLSLFGPIQISGLLTPFLFIFSRFSRTPDP